jgi:hypothetical protein
MGQNTLDMVIVAIIRLLPDERKIAMAICHSELPGYRRN